MVLLSIILGILLSAAQAWATITASSDLGSATATTAGTTLVITTGATVEAGHVYIVRTGGDNVGTTDAQASEVTSIVDSAGNTGAIICPWRNGNGAADAGAIVSTYLVHATTQLPLGGTITVTYVNSIARRVATAREFIVDSGKTLQRAGACQNLSTDAGDPGSQSLSGLTNKQYLFFRAIASESDYSSGAVSATTASYSVLSSTAADGGTDVDSIGVSGEIRIATLTGSTSDPAMASGANDKDHASVFFAMEEVSLTAPSTTKFKVMSDLF